MVEDKNKQICENCKNFKEYYIIYKTRLCRTRTGYCLLKTLHFKDKRVKVYCSDYCCENWERELPPNEEDIKASVKRLSDSAEKLANVLQVKL